MMYKLRDYQQKASDTAVALIVAKWYRVRHQRQNVNAY